MDAPADNSTATTGPPAWARVVPVAVGLLLGFVAGGLLGVLLGVPLSWLAIQSSDIWQTLVGGLKNGFIFGGLLGMVVGAVLGSRARLLPLTQKKIRRFISIKRGYYSFLLLAAMFAFSLVGELFVGSQALMVSHQGRWYFPCLPFSGFKTGQDFGMEKDGKGQEYTYSVNYRELQKHFESEGEGWVLMPLIPYNPLENDFEPYRGRYVRIEQQGEEGRITVAEVEVLQGKEDIVGNGTATLGVAGMDPWWELDFGAEQVVDDIKIGLPGKEVDWDQDHMRNFTVRLLDENREGVWSREQALEGNLTGRSISIKLLVPMRAPDLRRRHILGTDSTARDVFARLFFGFRISMTIALGFMMMVYLIGVAIGCLMGYFGGWVDLIGQRGVEIWQNIPFLYMVIIVMSVVKGLPFKPPEWFQISVLLAVLVLFSWTSMTYYMRTAVYREKARDYVAAAQLLGASTSRVLFNHLMPNTISTMVTFMPFIVSSAIISVTALDYLGFGLPKPVPSWGELLQQGVRALEAPWIVLSAFFAMMTVLMLVTFIGEAIREAFDPKKFTTYE